MAALTAPVLSLRPLQNPLRFGGAFHAGRPMSENVGAPRSEVKPVSDGRYGLSRATTSKPDGAFGLSTTTSPSAGKTPVSAVILT